MSAAATATTATATIVSEDRTRRWADEISDSSSDEYSESDNEEEEEYVPVKAKSYTKKQPMKGLNTLKTNKFNVSIEEKNGDVKVIVANMRDGVKPNDFEWNVIYQNLSYRLFNTESRQTNEITAGIYGYSGFTVTICFQSGNNLVEICDFYVIEWFCRHCMFCTHHYDDAHPCNFHGSNHEISEPSKDGIPNAVYLFDIACKKGGVWGKKPVHPGFKTDGNGRLIQNTSGDDQITFGVPVLFTDVRDLTETGFGDKLVSRFTSKNLNLEHKKLARKEGYVSKDHSQEFPSLPPSAVKPGLSFKAAMTKEEEREVPDTFAGVTDKSTNGIMVSDDEASRDEVSQVSNPSVVESAMTHDEEIEDLEKRIKIASLKKQLRELEEDSHRPPQGMYPSPTYGYPGYQQPFYLPPQHFS